MQVHRGRINNNLYKDSEKTGGEKPIDLIKATRPIVIVDEPQSVDGGLTGAGKTALDAMNPLCTLRYSATHAKATLIKYRHWSNFGQPRPVWTQRRLGLAAQRALYRPLSPFLAPTGAPVPSAFGGRGRCWPVPGQ